MTSAEIARIFEYAGTDVIRYGETVPNEIHIVFDGNCENAMAVAEIGRQFGFQIISLTQHWLFHNNDMLEPEWQIIVADPALDDNDRRQFGRNKSHTNAYSHHRLSKSQTCQRAANQDNPGRDGKLDLVPVCE